MNDPYNADLEKGFLPIEGSKVMVLGTRWNGFRGEVVAKPKNWPERAIAIKLDEWDEPIKLYRHNIFTEIEIFLKS
jgi:hypothetical protein